MIRHILITNDFPPKLGGIQSYLWELWRRLPSESFSVITHNQPGAAEFDALQEFKVHRVQSKILLPSRGLINFVNSTIAAEGARYVILDPAFPLGMIGKQLDVGYGVIVHGAEISVPGRIPFLGSILRSVLSSADFVVAAGGWPAKEAQSISSHRIGRLLELPPGVDTQRFSPISAADKGYERLRLGVAPDAKLIVSLSRLVPRKGMDLLIKAVAMLAPKWPDVFLVIGGAGRDADRLDRLIKHLRAPAKLVGKVSDEHLAPFYGCADIFAMLCRTRWMGLEQEGYGIVYLEAAAMGTPQVAGRSGGAHEAVLDGQTGIVVDHPNDPHAVAAALEHLLEQDSVRTRMGEQARRRVEVESNYDYLARQLEDFLDLVIGD